MNDDLMLKELKKINIHLEYLIKIVHFHHQWKIDSIQDKKTIIEENLLDVPLYQEVEIL